MPSLDRRVVVRRTVTTRNSFGEAVQTVTDLPMWASRLDASVIDTSGEGGELTTSTRAYIVRWRRDLAEALVSELSVIEGGLTLNALNVMERARERDERRRFLRIEAVGEVTS